MYKGEAVRAKVKTPDPSKLQTTVRVFFNDVGYELRISVEDAAREDGTSPKVSPGKSRDGAAGTDGDGRDGGNHSRSRSPSSMDDDESSGPDGHLNGSKGGSVRKESTEDQGVEDLAARAA